MYIARLLFPVNVLGPGNRIGIWFDGCEHHCRGCSNPELWETESKYYIGKHDLMTLIHSIIEANYVDGFTLTGGDPFYQPNALAELLPEISKISSDILIYTGYEYLELKKKYPELLKYVGVLIDGRYIQERNNGAFLRGSDNQKIWILNKNLEEIYKKYCESNQNIIQNFKTKDATISVGIHKTDFEIELNRILEEKGVYNE